MPDRATAMDPAYASSIAQNLERMLKSENPHTVLEAGEGLMLLAELSPTLAMPLIRLAHAHSDHHVRQGGTKAICALAIADADLAHSLFLELFEGKAGDPMSLEPVRQLNLLCEIAPWLGAPILRDLLKDHENLANNYAAYALAPLAESDPALALGLIEVAVKDADEDIRKKGATGLLILAKTYPDKVRALNQPLLHDESERVQLEAKGVQRLLDGINAEA